MKSDIRFSLYLLAATVIFAGSYLAKIAGIPQPFYILGFMLALFLPGATFLTLWPTAILRKINLLEATVHSIFLSLFLMPLATFLLTRIGIRLNEFVPFFLLTFNFLAFSILLIFSKERRGLWQRLLRQWPAHRTYLLAALALSTVFTLSLARLEPFLPEYDGWWHLIFGEKVKEVGSTAYGGPWSNFRPFFLHWMVNLEFLSGIDSFTLTKWVLPAFGVFASVLSLRVYADENDLTRRKPLLLLLLALPFAAPLFISQIIYVRAQYPVMIAALYVLFLAKRRHPFFNLLGFALILLGIMFHEFSLFYLSLFVVIMGVRYWEIIVARWRILLPHLIYLSLLAFAYRSIFWGTVLRPFQATAPVLDQMQEEGLSFNLNLFFWKNYIGSDRLYQLTNYEILKFYAHHLLILITPLIGIWLLIRLFRLHKENRSDLAFRYALFGTLLLLLFIVEVLPRFGVPMDPERPWIFINYLILAILADLLITVRWKRKAFSIVGTGVFATALLSLGVTGSFIYERNKRVYTTDVPVIEFIRRETPANSLVIAPFEKQAPLFFFTDRLTAPAPHLPLWQPDVEGAADSQKILATLQDNFSEAREERVLNLRNRINGLLNMPDPDLKRVMQLLQKYEETKHASFRALPQREVYLLVSRSPSTAAWTDNVLSDGERYQKERNLIWGSELFETVFEDSANTLFRYVGPDNPKLSLDEAEAIEKAISAYLAPIGASL